MRCRIDARRALPLAAITFVVLLGTAAPVFAASGGGGGLSFLQLERWDLGIFTLIVFGLLLLILQKTAWPKIIEGLQKREEAITSARDEALQAKQEAEELRLKLQADLAKAQCEVRAMLDEARKDADALRQQEREVGVKEAEIERERATREIAAAKDIALKEIYQQAVDLAATMSSKALGREITPDDHRKLLDESLAELAQVVAKPSA